jgi:SAM-dependent methyltransferase
MTTNTQIEGDLDGLLSKFLIDQRQNIVRPYFPGKKNILDLGCGVFRWGKTIQAGVSYTGVDIEPDIVVYNQSNFPAYSFHLQNIDREGLSFPSCSFDLVIMLAIIEHLANPVQILEEVRRVMTDDGVIGASTPHPRGEMILEMGSKIKIFSQDKHQHQPLLDRAKMEEIADKAGLKITEFRPFLFGFNQKIVMRKA